MASGLPALQSGRQQVLARTPSWLSKRLALALQAWRLRPALALLVFSRLLASSRPLASSQLLVLQQAWPPPVWQQLV